MLIQESRQHHRATYSRTRLRKYLVWAIFGRKKAGYFRWIGLFPIFTGRGVRTALLLFIPLTLIVGRLLSPDPELHQAAAADNTVAGTIKAQVRSARKSCS